jgi:dye decolorizing peroxidase
VSGSGSPGGRPRLSRRRFLIGGATLAAGGVGAAIAVDETSAGGHSDTGTPAEDQPRLPLVALGAQPAGLPARQHAWEASETRDRYGNPVAPRFDRLLFFDVRGEATPRHARILEAALRTLERRFHWSPDGLLFTVSWGPRYFTRNGGHSPIPRAKGLSDFELPTIDDYEMCLHLAGDDQARLAEIEAALLHGAPLSGADGHLDLSTALVWRETRTGFTGAGLPAAHQEVGGIPPGRPVAETAPLFMGFRSNLKRNQATEDSVTIASGPFADGTTMAVSYMRLRLDSWYQDLSERERVARMYAPQVSPAQAARFTTDAESDPGGLERAISRDGVIGHAQTSARARRHGKPIILRRDFDTVDGGQAGLHFVSLQRSIEDFVRTRTAMNASSAQLSNPAITDTVNNGINEFIFVLRRANYLVPRRAARAFPSLAGEAVV